MKGYHRTTDEPYQEIRKLQEMLEKAKIPYEFEPLFDGWHILYPYSVKTECSVIEHLFTTGMAMIRSRSWGCLRRLKRNVILYAGPSALKKCSTESSLISSRISRNHELLRV